jgi:hypothetical protein
MKKKKGKYLAQFLCIVFLTFSTPKTAYSSSLTTIRQETIVSNTSFFTGEYQVIEEDGFSYQTRKLSKYPSRPRKGKGRKLKENECSNDLKEFQRISSDFEQELKVGNKNRVLHFDSKSLRRSIFQFVNSPTFILFLIMKIFKK